MKNYILIIFTLLLSGLVYNANAQNLTLGNGEERTLTVDATYDVITLNNGSNLIIPAGVTITATTLDIKNSAVIDLKGVLNITGNVDVKNNAVLTINNTGAMDVGGDFNANAGASIVNDGVVSVDGNYSGPTPTGGGSMTDSSGTVQSPLPVKLLYASADVESNEVIVTWATSAEINNDYFSIKVSRNMQNWELVDQVSGVGNSSNTNEYSYSFTPDMNGNVYIQLSQTDYDGTHEILKVMNVHVSNSKISLYPMPVREGQQWHIRGINSNDKVQVYNSAMVPVENKDNLIRGFYYVVINDNTVKKLIVK